MPLPDPATSDVVPRSSEASRAKALSMNFPLFVPLFGAHLVVAQVQRHSVYFVWSDIGLALFSVSALGVLLLGFFRWLLHDLKLSGLAGLIVLLALFPRIFQVAPLYVLGAVLGLAGFFFQFWQPSTRGRVPFFAIFTLFLNAISAAALAAAIAHALLISNSARRTAEQLVSPLLTQEAEVEALVTAGLLPHIVHIVLDGYSRADVLEEIYDHDNSDFLNTLRKMDFRIGGRATVPYNQTLLVMASVFAMTPITDIAAQRGVSTGNRTFRVALTTATREGEALKTLDRLGYEMRSTPTSYPPMEWASATESIATSGWEPKRLGPFVLLQGILNQSPVLSRLGILPARYRNRSTINYEVLSRVPRRRFHPSGERPLFVYQHIIAPHPPFNVLADGSEFELPGFPPSFADGAGLIRGNETRRASYREGYVEKLRFINDAIARQIEGILATIPEPRIIIVHGDHGGGLYFDSNSAERTCARERFATLFAVHASDESLTARFHDDFDIINLYRVLLRSLLSLELPDLPSRQMFVPWSGGEITPIDSAALERPCEPTQADGPTRHSSSVAGISKATLEE